MQFTPAWMPRSGRLSALLLTASLGLLPLLVWAADTTRPAPPGESATATAEAPAERSAEDQQTEQRLLDDARYLASDELEGRGLQTKGLEQAAQYIAKQFAQAGLKVDLIDGGPFQRFPVVSQVRQGTVNRLELVGPPDSDGKPQRIELRLDRDFRPLAIGASGKFDVPVVFVGYGISASDQGYDDYANVDVEGKAVVVMRKTPQQANPHGPFASPHGPSMHATFSRKLSNAYQHGAAAVLFCNDLYGIEEAVRVRVQQWKIAIGEFREKTDNVPDLLKDDAELTAEQFAELEKIRSQVDELASDVAEKGRELAASYDPLLPFAGAGTPTSSSHLPTVFVRRRPLDRLLRQALKTDLASLEQQIDEGPKPQSRELTGWRLLGEITVDRVTTETANVIGVLEGEGPHADETIVVGAHFDHLGRGEEGSLARGSDDIHNGADDNASGTAVLLEVARKLAARKTPLPRRVVFIAFSGEERGLLGSNYYCEHPLFPLDKTVAMLNMDMVGRLKDNKLIVNGIDTARQFESLVDQLNATLEFDLSKQPGGFGPSDHASFFAKKLPVLHFFTGLHDDYHRPTDDVEHLSIDGMRRVADLVSKLAVNLAELTEPLEFVESHAGITVGGGGDRPYFGSIPDFGQQEKGYAISGVTKGSPAEKGGLKGGDRIIRLGENRIGSLEDFDGALRKFKAGDKVPVVVIRDGQEVELEVRLGAPR